MKRAVHNKKSGFTLVELLVVVAIVAILAVVVIITLNPAELLKQARDSNRVSDLAMLKSAVSFYLADGQAITSAANTCYVSSATTTANCGGRFVAGTYALSATTSRVVDGTGWVGGINFSAISGRFAISQLPIDPINDTSTYYYAYTATTTNNYFEFNAKLESAKYSSLQSLDGGTSSTTLEVGSNPNL